MSMSRQNLWYASQLIVGTLVAGWIFDEYQQPDLREQVTTVNAAMISEWIGLVAAFVMTKAICLIYDAIRRIYLRYR